MRFSILVSQLVFKGGLKPTQLGSESEWDSGLGFGEDVQALC